MSDRVKQTLVYNIIFPYITEKKKLSLTEYNKNIQNALNISLINYKIQSGKYKIGERNGEGEEYNIDDDQLIFEGEYINGKRSGKGKEYYYDGELKFEGEYLNGKRSGKGKEYNDDGILIFDGEYQEGKEIYGKKYNNKGNIIFELANKNGIGKEYIIMRVK